jgi:hypothetical protein
MRSLILIGSYLWKDTWKRWFEQPSSPLARLFVTGLLVLVATVILVIFQLLERSLRDRLEKFGLNTVLVREVVASDSKELILSGPSPDRLAPLSRLGHKLRLRQLFTRGQTEWQNSLVVLSYPPEALNILAELLSPETPVLCLSDALPEDSMVRVTVSRQSHIAKVRKPQGWLRPLVSEDVLLVPQGLLPDEERLGFMDTTIFQRKETAPGVAEIVKSIQALYSADRRSPPQIQSALGLVRELENLKAKQKQVRNILAGILGVALALVYGAIAILEFRQNLFVSALLRSFGAPRQFLYWRHWIENMLLANVAACAAIATVAGLHQALFGSFGFPKLPLTFSAGNPYLGAEMLALLAWVNLGAFFSSLPIAAGLRQPVGGILN